MSVDLRLENGSKLLSCNSCDHLHGISFFVDDFEHIRKKTDGNRYATKAHLINPHVIVFSNVE